MWLTHAIAITSTRGNIQHYLLPEENCSADDPSEHALIPLRILHNKNGCIRGNIP